MLQVCTERSCISLWVTQSCSCLQSNTLFITNQNQRSEPPEQIVRDIVAGFPDDILDRNAGKPWKGGFLQDARRVSATVRPFLFEGQNWSASTFQPFL